MDLSFLDSLESLSRTHTLLPESRRRCDALEAEVAAAEREAPALLESAARDMAAAHVQLAALAGRAAQLEESLSAQRDVCDQLDETLSGPHRALRQLRQAEVVLATLADNDSLAAQVSRATANGDAAMRTTALLRLLLLRLIVADSVAGGLLRLIVADSVAGGGDALADCTLAAAEPAAAAAEERTVGLALAQLVGSRLQSVLPPLRAPMAARLAAALKALGWPAAPQTQGDTSGDVSAGAGHAPGFVTGSVETDEAETGRVPGRVPGFVAGAAAAARGSGGVGGGGNGQGGGGDGGGGSGRGGGGSGNGGSGAACLTVVPGGAGGASVQMEEARAAMCDLLLLQFCAWAAGDDGDAITVDKVHCKTTSLITWLVNPLG